MKNVECRIVGDPRGKRNAKLYYLIVGATTMFSKKTCRLAMWSSEVVSVTAAHPSVAQKRDLQEPSLVREHVAKRLSSFLRKRRVADKRSLRSAG